MNVDGISPPDKAGLLIFRKIVHKGELRWKETLIRTSR